MFGVADVLLAEDPALADVRGAGVRCRRSPNTCVA